MENVTAMDPATESVIDQVPIFPSIDFNTPIYAARLYDTTSTVASIANSLQGSIEDFATEPEPEIPAAETSPPAATQPHRETRRERRARYAAEKKKAKACHKIFRRLPR